MKLFVSVQDSVKIAGIYASNQQEIHINWRNVVFLLAFVHTVIDRALFLQFEAQTALEYGFSFYSLASGLACAAAFLICIWKSSKMFNTVQDCEKFIEKST